MGPQYVVAKPQSQFVQLIVKVRPFIFVIKSELHFSHLLIFFPFLLSVSLILCCMESLVLLSI